MQQCEIPYTNPVNVIRRPRDISNTILAKGPVTQRFEKAAAVHLGSKFAIATGSGTISLYCVYRALGLRGKKIIMPSFTWRSTAEAALMAGAIPVFCDIEQDTFCIDPEKVGVRYADGGGDISAVVAVDCFGCPAEYDALLKASSNAPLIVDSAHSFGATYRGHGIGHYGIHCFSLSPTKVLTSGEGGLITCNDENLAEELRDMRSWAGRMTEYNAGCALDGLKNLPNVLASKTKIFANYSRYAKQRGWQIQQVSARHTSTCKDVIVVLETGAERDALQAHLAAAGIETKVYFVPCHTMPHFSSYDRDEIAVTTDLFRRSLCLPSWRGMNQEYVFSVLDKIKEKTLCPVGMNRKTNTDTESATPAYSSREAFS